MYLKMYQFNSPLKNIAFMLHNTGMIAVTSYTMDMINKLMKAL
jgi:hypothetical protein